jgi:hypothetical protein
MMEGLIFALFFVGLFIYGWRTGFSDGREDDN